MEVRGEIGRSGGEMGGGGGFLLFVALTQYKFNNKNAPSLSGEAPAPELYKKSPVKQVR